MNELGVPDGVRNVFTQHVTSDATNCDDGGNGLAPGYQGRVVAIRRWFR